MSLQVRQNMQEFIEMNDGWTMHELRHVVNAKGNNFFCITHVTLPYVPSPNLLNYTPCYPPPSYCGGAAGGTAAEMRQSRISPSQLRSRRAAAKRRWGEGDKHG